MDSNIQGVYAELNGNYYTLEVCDIRYYTKTQSDNNYYNKAS